MGFGQYDEGGSSQNAMRAGVYRTVIKKANVKRNQAGTIVTDQRTSKAKFELVVDVAGPRHVGEKLKKTMLVAFGQNAENGQWSQFARFIEHATGIPCGDLRQKEVDEPDLVGHDLWVMVKHERGWNNIVDFLEPEEDDRPPYKRVEDDVRNSVTRATTSTPPAQTQPATALRINAGKQRQIEALAKARRVSDTILADLIEKLTKGGTRLVSELAPREAEALIAALKDAAA